MRFSIGGVGQVVTGREGTRRQRQFQTVESTAWKAGSHTVRFGADYRRMVPIRRDATGVLSAIADDITSLTDKKNLWLGSSPAVSAATEVTELSLWAQDTWQISPRIVITPGLRWELNPSPAAAPSTYFLDPQTGTFFDRNNRPLWPVPYTNFAPRLGGAWRVRKSGRTVLRAGGGLFYDSSLSIATDLINSGPFNITQFTNGIHGLVSSLLSYAFSPNLQLPRLTEWNFTLDQALGAHDVALDRLRRVDGPPPVPPRSRRPRQYSHGTVRAHHQQRRVRIPRPAGAVSPQGAAGLSVAGILLLVALAG